MNIQQWQDKVHEAAKERGWWAPLEDDPANMTSDILASKLMLIVSELSEALEEIRNGKPDLYFANPLVTSEMISDVEEAVRYAAKGHKPEGVVIELADAVIRIMDLCGFMGWSLSHALWIKSEYNKTREFRHGGKVL